MSDPTRNGASTLEGKLAIFGTVAGAVLSGLTVTFGMLEQSFPNVGWLGAVAGMIAVGASVFGIAKSRGQVKAADIVATAAKSIAGALGPSAGLSTLGISTPPTVTEIHKPNP